ncbi:hypothetical protein RTB9991CWPP_00380 [Rickettsia typhi str. B9991CWPP]|uniref:Uncharacterized protein n=1 Tax=Rickettsia typhi str. TH1527 TaxID=1003201 RepID=A0ABM5MW95_RICTP|nr:hypothetical protein RTTH1527_00380 [Rickettsia typhi str. TH1527]AFE54781.1 hypothetical protein RTB9991CWPP_00380 [Rickettsia typhi str. B9991CWPP]
MKIADNTSLIYRKYSNLHSKVIIKCSSLELDIAILKTQEKSKYAFRRKCSKLLDMKSSNVALKKDRF